MNVYLFVFTISGLALTGLTYCINVTFRRILVPLSSWSSSLRKYSFCSLDRHDIGAMIRQNGGSADPKDMVLDPRRLETSVTVL